MNVEPLPLRGAALLRSSAHRDDRGSFRRLLDIEVMAANGLETSVAQVSVATNTRTGTVRGLHFQASPHGETKTLWCSGGAVYDVLVDLRPGEPTYGASWSTELSADEPVALHVPPGIAHGYQTLTPDAEMTYVISTAYEASAARVVRWDDPELGIPWPRAVTAISSRDEEAPGWPVRY